MSINDTGDLQRLYSPDSLGGAEGRWALCLLALVIAFASLSFAQNTKNSPKTARDLGLFKTGCMADRSNPVKHEESKPDYQRMAGGGFSMPYRVLAQHRARLDVSAGAEEKYWITSTREPCQPTDKATMRGTVFHERRSGEQAAVFLDDGQVLLRVSCRAAAGELTEAIPYALAVSFEVGIDAGIQVYDEIRTRMTAPVRANINAGS